MNDVTAILLAGGLGTRLRSVVSDRPKVLADVAGRPFLLHLLDQIQHAGISCAVISTGYMADFVERTIGRAYHGITIEYAVETEPLGTGGALRHAAAQVGTDRVVVMNGDSFIDVDLAAFVRAHVATGVAASIVVTHVENASRYGAVDVDPEGRVTAFNEKTGVPRTGWINAGVYVIDRSVLAMLPDATPLSLEREVWPALIARGIGAHRCDGAFIDIGTPDSYAAADTLFRSGRPVRDKT